MPLPRGVARFNKRVTNRVIEPLARRTAGFAVIHHVGRRSGSSYTTPVNLFVADGDAIVALTYGATADWFSNVQAGPARVESHHRLHDVVEVRLAERQETWPHLPKLVRLALRLLRVHHFCRMSLLPPITSQ